MDLVGNLNLFNERWQKNISEILNFTEMVYKKWHFKNISSQLKLKLLQFVYLHFCFTFKFITYLFIYFFFLNVSFLETLLQP